MTTLGIDLSSQSRDTAACVVEWRDGAATASPAKIGCSDSELDRLIAGANAIGIDAPFGWPAAFEAAVAQWTAQSWTNDLRDKLRFRGTDRFVQERTGLWPLSVSSDRIALPAMRAMALLRRHNVTDRSGDGRFFEVYPAGSLRSWKLTHNRYKGSDPENVAVRKRVLFELRVAIPCLSVADDLASSDHGFDALVAALSARVAAQGMSVRPADERQRSAARTEGWIHLPGAFPQ